MIFGAPEMNKETEVIHAHPATQIQLAWTENCTGTKNEIRQVARLAVLADQLFPLEIPKAVGIIVFLGSVF